MLNSIAFISKSKYLLSLCLHLLNNLQPCLFHHLEQNQKRHLSVLSSQENLSYRSPSLCLKASRTNTDLHPEEDANPTLKMENKESVSAAGTQDNPIMKPVDQRARFKGRNDIITRRLKNRERQRRYRARKRLEAEINKSSDVKVTLPVQAELESNGSDNNGMTRRIYCKRDWKKDARRARALKIEQVTPNGSFDPFQTLTGEPEAGCLASGNKAEAALDREIQSSFSRGLVNTKSPRIVLSRRDWKAEARKKKN